MQRWLTKSQGRFDFASSMNFFSSAQTLTRSLKAQKWKFPVGSSCPLSWKPAQRRRALPIQQLYGSQLFIYRHYLFIFKQTFKEKQSTDTRRHIGTVNTSSSHLLSLLWKSRQKGDLPPGFCSPGCLQLSHTLRSPSSISLFSVEHSFASQC